MKSLLQLLALAALTVPAAAQGTTPPPAVTVGPLVVPQGGDLLVTLSNDGGDLATVLSSLWSVRDDAGAVVHLPTTTPSYLTLLPDAVHTETWDLRDAGGALVAPGTYHVDVRDDLASPVTTVTIDVVVEGAGLVLEGTATLKPFFGAAGGRDFYMTSPDDPGLMYLLLASATATTGTPTCGPTLPLDPSPLLDLSLTPGHVFFASLGVLDGNGESKQASVKIPNDPYLVGFQCEAAFVVLDPAAPCIVKRASNVHTVVVVP